jgi:hypothetical protein
MPPDPSRRTILKSAKIAPSFNGMSAFDGMSGVSYQSKRFPLRGKPHQGRAGIGQVLLALFGPVAVRV